MIPPVLVDAEVIKPMRGPREIGHDERHMSNGRNHGIRLVGKTLERSPGVRVNVGDDGQFLSPAKSPERCERIALQHANAACVGVRIELVVKDALCHMSPTAIFNAQ